MKKEFLAFLVTLLFVDTAVLVFANEISLENLLLTAASPLNLTTDNLICSYNLDGNATTAATAWYKNNTPNLVFYMPMEGNEQNALLDYSGNGNNGTEVGNPIWNSTSGYDGNGAFDFDGDDYIDAGNIMSQQAYTKTAWVKFIPGGISQNIISGNNGGHAFYIANDAGYRLEAGHNGVWNSVFDPETFPENNWTFAALTYDPSVSNGTLTLYKNGVKVDDAINIPPILNDQRTLIGTYSAINLFNGSIDDVRIYDYALSAEQISSLYNNGGNIIANAETEVGDEWQCKVTPFSSEEAGATYISNSLVISEGLNIDLKQGWNLISIPLKPLNNSVNVVFGSINYSHLFTFNDGWKVPEEIDNNLGYWIKVDENVNLIIPGIEIENKTIDLKEGWNLIGCPYLEEKNISSLFENITAFVYDKSKWYSYNSNRPGNLNTLKQIEPGYGYWVKVG